MSVRPLEPHEAHRMTHGYPPKPRINALTDIAPVETWPLRRSQGPACPE